MLSIRKKCLLIVMEHRKFMGNSLKNKIENYNSPNYCRMNNLEYGKISGKGDFSPSPSSNLFSSSPNDAESSNGSPVKATMGKSASLEIQTTEIINRPHPIISSPLTLAQAYLNSNGSLNGSGGSLISPGGPNSIIKRSPSRLERVIKTLSKRHERTLDHIKNYIRLLVNIKGQDKLIITVDKRNTVESLVNQIEAEHAFDFPDDGVLECGFIYDQDLNLLSFESSISDVLDMYARVIITNIREDPDVINVRKYKNYRHIDEKEKHQAPSSKDKDPSSKSPRKSTANPEERFQAILHNKYALELFKDFCIEKRVLEYLMFWLEVECLQTLDPSQRLLTMKFIYLTYINDSAPLKINLLTELKKDVEFPTANSNISIFDEAQEYVYAILKRLAFIQFERSPKVAVLQNLRKQDMEEYKKGTIESYAQSFQPPYESLFVVLGREDPNPYMDASVRTEEQQQQYLSNAVSRFFKASIIADYWHDPPVFNSQAQKVKNILKEKKLSKFFGQRLKTEDIMQQFEFGNNSQIGKHKIKKHQGKISGYGKGAFEESDENHIFDETVGALDDTVEEEDDDDDYNDDMDSDSESDGSGRLEKKKKADKLTEFFGDRIPKRQLKSQNLVPSSNTTTQISIGRQSITDTSNLGESSNMISGEQKLVLSRRTKKLNTVFGEALDEVNIKKHIVEPVKRKMEAAAAAAAASTPEANIIISDANDSQSVNVGSVSSSSINSNGSIKPASNNLRRNSQKNYYSKKRISMAMESPLEDEDPEITKLIRRRKAEKLHQFLGERINEKLLQIQVAATKKKLSDEGNGADSSNNRKPNSKPELVRKANKLERLFGELPPSDLILLTRNALPAERKSIISLQILLDNNTDVKELISFMESSGASAENLQAANDEMKNAKQKRLNKLRSFFGEFINPQELIEKHILSYLEESIEEKYSGEDLYKLKEDLDNLRERVRRYSIKESAREDDSQVFDKNEMMPSSLLSVPKADLKKSLSEPIL